MKKLSENHKIKISEGLRKSKKHKASQRNKDVSGNKNPNWRKKITYYCPVCNKEMLVTKNNFRYLTKINRSCSRKCGSIIGKAKITGRKRPDVSNRMKRDNPMSNPDVAARQSKSIRKSYRSGKLDDLKKKLSVSGRQNIRKYNKSIRTRVKTRIRMKKNNPMFRKEIALKVSKSLRNGYKEGRIKPPDLTGSRFLRGTFTDKNGSQHQHDSSWELKRMEFLDKFLTITWKKNKRQYRVGYIYNGKLRTYFPDFIIRRRGSENIIVEEVGSWMENKKSKIKSAKGYFAKRGIKYVVISKEELQLRTW